MCSPVVLWTHPGEHPDSDIESRREQEAVYVQHGIFYLRSLLLVSAYRFLSLSGDSVPPERPVDARGNGRGGKEILMSKTPSPCGLSFLHNEFLSCRISTNVECPDGRGRVAGFGKSTDRVDQ